MDCKGCEKGISMCYTRPCMGTPEEFEAIIDAGFANKLRIDHWNGHHGFEGPTQEEIDEETDPSLKKVLQSIFDVKKTIEPNPFKDDVEFLAGGTPNDKNYRAPFWPTGRCNLLTEDDLCSLHDLGLKPEQGRKACCKNPRSDEDGNLTYVKLWATEKGKQVIEKFKKEVGI